jgi:predicted transcriptional regulator
MPKTVKDNIEVPAGISDQARDRAQREADEAAVLARWQQQELTIREAAEELGLTYRAFLDLLAAKDIPVERGPVDLAALQAARKKLAGGHP